MLQLCWKAGPEQYPPDELLEYAVAAEQAGFDALDASDHFHPWAEAGQAAFVWTWLGAAAVVLSATALGVGLVRGRRPVTDSGPDGGGPAPDQPTSPHPIKESA